MKKISLITAAVLIVCILLSMNVFAAQTVTDTEQNISFEIPDGWTQTAEDKYAFYKTEDGIYKGIAYNVVDLYSYMTSEQKSQYSRSELNNAAITVEDYRELMESDFSPSKGYTNYNFDRATVGNYDFFKVTFKQTLDDGIVLYVTVFVHVYNGYESFFRFESTERIDEDEVMSVMNTVRFSGETGKNKTKTDAQKFFEDVGTETLSRVAIGVAVAGIPAIGGLAARSRVRRREKKAEKKNAKLYGEQYNQGIPTSVPTVPVQQPVNNNSFTYSQPQNEGFTQPSAADAGQPADSAWTCPYCGTTCYSKFCSNCGAQKG